MARHRQPGDLASLNYFLRAWMRTVSPQAGSPVDVAVMRQSARSAGDGSAQAIQTVSVALSIDLQLSSLSAGAE